MLVVLSALAFTLAVLAGTPHDHRVMAVDTRQSKLTVFVYKEGLFAFAADNHEVNVPIVSGSFDDAMKRVDIKIDTAKMQVQDPPSRRDKVQANMIGPEVLDVARYPKILFRSTKIALGDRDHWRITGDLTLHGQTHSVVFEVIRKDPKHFTGSGIVRQTNFGITPIKIAGGAVRVKDDVKIMFDIVLK